MIEKIMASLIAQQYKIFMRPFEVNILGVRNGSMIPDVFNDSICILYRNDKNQWEEHHFPATTDPGTFWLKNPLNPQGTAILKTGQYLNSHIMGLHRNKYMALVQRNPVTVIRDAKRDGAYDFNGKEDTGLFGINIHRAMQEGTTRYIDKFSAGCQVFANAEDFSAFMVMCQRHRQLYGNSFTYTLVDQSPAFMLAA